MVAGFLLLIVVGILIYIKMKDSERKQRLIELQNYITGVQHNSLHMSELQLKNRLSTFVNTHTRQKDLYYTEMISAKSPKVFFESCEKWKKERERLLGLNQFEYGMISLTNMNVKGTEDKAAREMIDRCWKATVEKVISLKTEKAKTNALENFFNTMFLYNDQFSKENQERIRELRDATFVE